MIKLLLTCILGLLFVPVFAGKITGTITDADGKTLPYASIFIKGSRRGTNANNEGRYVINLEPGQYTLVCQYVGYKRQEKTITVTDEDQQLDFTMSLQEMMLDEVMITTTGQNPATEIIKKTIAKRKDYQAQLDKFECEVYTKGQLRVRSYPKKLLGKVIDFEDGDTSKQKMLYLSETVSRYSVDKPNKEKIEVLSSRVSGQSNGYGLSAPQFFSLYDNNVFIGVNLNPRGFISPIADNATAYYKYKYGGAFYEDGRQINKIQVIPKRKFEPLFSGYINIVEDEWRIHSVQLTLTRESQMEIIDTLRLEQLYRPLTKDVWAISSQVIYPAIKILGFDAYGSFINIYSAFNVEPEFKRSDFNNTILKYMDSSNRKSETYWESTRPIPLLEDEISDYRRKDSLEIAKKDLRYLDSLSHIRNKLNIFGAMIFGQTFSIPTRRTSFTIRPITEQVSFNIVEGWVINTGAVWTKRIDSNLISRKSISLEPNLRYGFLNKHFNAHLTVGFTFGREHARSIRVSGGKRVFQYNNNSPIGPRGNTLSSLLSEKNRLKIYEAWYYRASYTQGAGHGFTWRAAFQYQDRIPLENRTDFSLRDIKNREYTPNYPSDLVSQNFVRHQAAIVLFGMSWQPGTRYIQMPEQIINIGSKYPVMTLEYITSFDKLLGSDVDFSKWSFSMKDDINFKLKGKFGYRIGAGGFFDHSKVQVQDFQHFNGNESIFATEYLNGFQNLPLYQFSNTSTFYALAHIEHNFHGFITNKIPGIRRLNLYLMTGGSGFYMKEHKYYEYFIGLANIFKQVRIDYVMSNLDGKSYKSHFRIGLSMNGKRRGDDWP
jgi:hypothetical protein